jgi:protein-tyrosine phosphatase
MISRLIAALRRRWRERRALATARDVSRQRLQGAPMKRILVVCYGNIYRSAFAGEYLRRRLGEDVEIRSSGFHRTIGRPSPVRHVAMSRSLGTDLAHHRSSLTTPQDLAWADTIVLMDRHNWTALEAMGADHRKLVWLGALGSSGLEIPDPYELDDARALQVLNSIEQACDALITRLRGAGATQSS